MLKFNECELTLYKKNAVKRSYQLELSMYEVMASTFGHEIEHTTNENIDFSIKKYELKIEEKPKQIASDIINEFRLNAPLPSINNLLELIRERFNLENNASIKLK